MIWCKVIKAYVHVKGVTVAEFLAFKNNFTNVSRQLTLKGAWARALTNTGGITRSTGFLQFTPL